MDNNDKRKVERDRGILRTIQATILNDKMKRTC